MGNLIVGVAAGFLIALVGTLFVLFVVVDRFRTFRTGDDAGAGDVGVPSPPVAYRTLDEGGETRRVALPVVQPPKPSCSSCSSFDLAGGQKIMAMNPAFQAATQYLPPWRMGRAFSTKPNPERVALEADLAAATDEATRASLRQSLEVIPAEIPLAPEEQVSGDLLGLDWSQFGACKAHSELRASTDTCDRYAARAS